MTPRDCVALALLLLILAVDCFYLFTRENNFPVDYHPTEQSKAEQLIAVAPHREISKLNFNHPLLLLETANIAQRITAAKDLRDVVIVGRYVSAAFATLAVTFLVAASFVSHGIFGAIITTALLGLCPPLLVYAHYFKEDTALIVGIAMTLFASRIALRSPTTSTAIFVGIAAAVAASGKYIGVVVILPSVLAICLYRANLLRRLAIFFASMLLAAALINFRALNAAAHDRIVKEFAHATTGNDYTGVGLRLPNLFCVRVAMSEIMPHVWIILVAGIVALVVHRKISRWGIVLASFFAVIGITLSFNAIPVERYALPITVLIYFIAAELLARLPKRIAMISIVFIVALQGQRCWNFTNQFADDSRQRLRDWIAAYVPASSFVAADSYAGLAGAGDPWRHPDQPTLNIRVLHPDRAADVAGENVDYIVTAEPNYSQLFVKGAYALRGEEAQLHARRKFYCDLFEHGELLWQSNPSPPTNAYVNPELRVYRARAKHALTRGNG